jgi:hypothetical protein
LNDEGFKKFLENKISEKAAQHSIKIVKEAEDHLNKKRNTKNLDKANIEDLQILMKYFCEKRKNNSENLLAVLRYSRFVGNQEIEVALLELLDGNDVLENLSKKVKKTFGEELHREIFEGINLPPLGTFSVDKPKVTRKLMDGLEAKLGEEGCRKVLLSGPHAAPKKEYLPERNAFLKSGNVDNFLQKRHKEYLHELEQHMKENTLYFTQEIDEEVLNYVRSTPTCQNGVREGDIIYVTKIPYMAKLYLNEKNERMKRYYYCHCPWVREGIKSGIDISANFCYCSAGYEKLPWDVIFDQPVKAEVIESVLKGDLKCKFAIYIPEKYLKVTRFRGKRKVKKILRIN